MDATNMSQLACCLLRLQHSIAWEKSIMKVVSRAVMYSCMSDGYLFCFRL